MSDNDKKTDVPNGIDGVVKKLEHKCHMCGKYYQTEMDAIHCSCRYEKSEW
jgi:hypothetical protein